MTGACHICGGDVSESNDKGILLSLFNGRGPLVYLTKTQHVIAGAYRGAHKVCPGSPSLAQYLPGMPKDDRTTDNGFARYPIDPRNIARVREMWGKMQLGDV